MGNKKEIHLTDLNNKNFIAFIKELPTRRAVDAILKNNKVNVAITYEFDNVETLKQFLELGDGISLLPEITVQQEVKKKDLVSIQITEGPFYRDTGIVTRKDRPLSRAAHEAIKYLLK